MIEQQLIRTLIVSTDYIDKARVFWQVELLESATAQLIAGWCLAYYDEYGEAPGANIHTLFYAKLEEGLNTDIAEEIEQDILPNILNNTTKINIKYLVSLTKNYFLGKSVLTKSRQIENVFENSNTSIATRAREVQNILDNINSDYITESSDDIDLASPEALVAMEHAFSRDVQPVVRFAKQLGSFFNSQLIPGALVAFMAPEKRGKTFLLLQIALQAVRQHKNVAFFQAGDMSRAEQLRRIAINLSGTSDSAEYCSAHYQSIRDCIFNQNDTCNKPERECTFGIFPDKDEDDFKTVTLAELIDALDDYPEYKPCFNCRAYKIEKMGTPYIARINECDPLEGAVAANILFKYMQKNKKHFYMSTHPNKTLTTAKITKKLDLWQRQHNFIPDVIITDYADIMVSVETDYRHKQNSIWQDLRALSQIPRDDIMPLVITATQADAGSYKVFTITLDNFTEDKRKFGHVTAMYGINQSPDGREKELGIMRLNELVIRDGAANHPQITILQNLRKGRAVVQSFF